ncbi:uncharacterized protein Tco025E_06935 [Trypanosoma conorhini]|uniref:Uncharacterized protein n=1 Tax=Trypanosoma conorhini TaxID=83891 RepID=A0A3R7NYI5_9TRYP|nr:uncharacterized protein Tco025E_06935 [Trypanosoma conorhini]RNF09769.1 hypothetical protein Tco025E_06935 [Trypanosoma conorhini]
MIAGLSTSPTSSSEGTRFSTGRSKRHLCSDAFLREYLNTLPSDFEGDACPPLLDEEERIERELAQLDRRGLKDRVASATLRCDEALIDLLEQEQLMGSTLSEVRHLESRLSDMEDEVETLRLQLQASDDYVEALLREKADVWRKLTESKHELANVSAKAARLQRDLAATTAHEKQRLSPLGNTPRAASAGGMSPAPVLRAHCSLAERGQGRGGSGVGDGGGLQSGPALNRTPQGERRLATDVAGTTPTGTTAAVPPLEPDSHTPAARQASARALSPFAAGALQEIEATQGEGGSLHNGSAETIDWRKRCLECQKRNEFLEKELAKAQGSSSGASKELTAHLLQSETSHDPAFAQELHSRLRRTVAELRRVEGELSAERERNHKQGKLETRLLQDVALFARKLRTHENAENEMRARRRSDLKLTREELLDELGRCRSTISGLTAQLAASSADELEQPQQQQAKSEASVTEELVSALEAALTANKALRAEKEVVLLEKKAREESYETELRSRVAEMERLTAALHELREQATLLGRQRPSTGASQRCLPAAGSPKSPTDNDAAGCARTPKTS